MNIIKPKSLKKGGTISIIAPAGCVDIEKVKNAAFYLNKKGYNIKFGSNIEGEYNYLAGSDSMRLEDIHNAFSDNDVDMILCARGGYGSIRLINDIDYDLIRNNPKIFCGYSDITILNAMFYKKSGLITFSGPMAQSDFNDINEYSQNEFFTRLSSNSNILYSKAYKNYGVCDEAQGILWGGNLSSLVSLCGIDFIPDERFILFVEDLNEDSYKLDRYFTQLLNIPKFKSNLSAVVLGDFLYVENMQYVEDLFSQLAKELDIPVIGTYPISHGEVKTTVPYGVSAILKGDKIILDDYLALQ